MAFSGVVGQQRAKEFLKQVMTREKIPHAYLFTGIPGIGKRSMAMALAMALNCREPVDREGCNRCPPCRQILSRNFPDFLSISPDGQNIKIGQIRELNRRLSFAPMSGRYRVCVVHRAETMTNEAANSFLKTLEEPPPGNILILDATEPLDLLPTIVSRCQRVSFQPLSAQDMATWLVENRGLKEEIAIVLARISGGSLGRTLRMCEAGFLEKRQEWLERLVGLHSLSKENALEMALECAGEDKNVGLDITETGEAGLTDMLSMWKMWYRDLLILKEKGPHHLLVNVDFFHKLKSMLGSFSIDSLGNSVFIIDQAQRDLQQRRNPTLLMEHVILGLKGIYENQDHKFPQ